MNVFSNRLHKDFWAKSLCVLNTYPYCRFKPTYKQTHPVILTLYSSVLQQYHCTCWSVNPHLWHDWHPRDTSFGGWLRFPIVEILTWFNDWVKPRKTLNPFVNGGYKHEIPMNLKRLAHGACIISSVAATSIVWLRWFSKCEVWEPPVGTYVGR